MKLYTIREIEKRLQTIADQQDPFIIQCKKDTRKGVQTLIQKWERKLQLDQELQLMFEEMKKYEMTMTKQGFEKIAGIDEVGRGPLAGPVVAAAVILPTDFYLPGMNDSKKLTERKREELFEIIINEAISYSIGVVHADEIDHLNIYQATKKAMAHAVNQLSIMPDFLLIDAMEIDVPIPQENIIKGDTKSVSIAAASIVAKVTRDRLMKDYSLQYPEYSFDKNMGYGTKEHLEAIHQYGPSPIHRKSFSPVKEMVENITGNSLFR